MMGSLKRGALIVIEGVDRSGKSTQCKTLVKSLQELNIKSTLLNFPDRTTLTGKIIDQYLRNDSCNLNDHAIHLLFAANRWESVDQMKKLLQDGVTLIVDRYSYSGIAFSARKPNMNLDWCKHPENGLPKPDLVFLLKLSPDEMFKRPGFGNERYENVQIQQQVSDMFQKMSDENDNWKVVDASGSIETVQKILLQQVLTKIKEVETSPIHELNFHKQ